MKKKMKLTSQQMFVKYCYIVGHKIPIFVFRCSSDLGGLASAVLVKTKGRKLQKWFVLWLLFKESETVFGFVHRKELGLFTPRLWNVKRTSLMHIAIVCVMKVFCPISHSHALGVWKLNWKLIPVSCYSQLQTLPSATVTRVVFERNQQDAALISSKPW